ncbi:ElyC/SanA/YdcF family protein [Rhodococcus sp. NPDC058521]|uniref:ElyC/SanA/YdcF family protein n=1 Tax=Rhodococcus sp. NPDC058521 TaxID=3346536 RepID=UPI003659251B
MGPVIRLWCSRRGSWSAWGCVSLRRCATGPNRVGPVPERQAHRVRLVLGWGSCPHPRVDVLGQFSFVADLPGRRSAPVPTVIVLGSKVVDGESKSFLKGRLDVAAAELVDDGRAKAVLVSGNGVSDTGDEAAVMTDYLAGKGVDRRTIIEDGYG